MLPYEYNIFEFIGNIGVILLIATYYVSTLNVIKNKKYINILNLVSAILLLINLIKHPNISGILIEVFWILISLVALFRKD